MIENILMKIPDIILIANIHNKVVFANAAWGTLIGERSEDYIGKSLKDTFSKINGKSDFLAEEFEKPLSNTKTIIQPEHRKKKAGPDYERDPLISQSSGHYNFTPPSVISLGGNIYSYQIFNAGMDSDNNPLKGLILNDFTEEQDFLDRMTQAENISSLKTLAAGISHEISNPLHSILTFSEAITEEKDLNKIRLYAEKVRKNSIRLGKVLSDFSGYIQKKEQSKKKEINIIESIKAAINFALLPYPGNEIILEENFEDIPSLIADPEEIQQIFFNITNNAIQAMKDKGRLKVSTHKNENSLVIKFEDNGPGMPPDILRKVFNPFFTTKMQGEGTGLGLNITQRLAEKYGGNIEIESQEGKGTEVSIHFPIPLNLPTR